MFTVSCAMFYRLTNIWTQPRALNYLNVITLLTVGCQWHLNGFRLSVGRLPDNCHCLDCISLKTATNTLLLLLSGTQYVYPFIALSWVYVLKYKTVSFSLGPRRLRLYIIIVNKIAAQFCNFVCTVKQRFTAAIFFPKH